LPASRWARIEANKPMPLKKAEILPGPRPWPNSQADVVKPMLGEKSALPGRGLATIIAGLPIIIPGWEQSGACSRKNLACSGVREILAGNGQEAITALVAKDKALEPEANAIAPWTNWSATIATSSSCEPTSSRSAIFTGQGQSDVSGRTLFSRPASCELCVRVDERGQTRRARRACQKPIWLTANSRGKCTARK